MLSHFLRAATPKGTFPILNNITTSLKGSSGTTFTINLPSNLVSNNGILMIVTAYQQPTISTPTGWTLVATGINGSSQRGPRVSVFIKVSNGAEGSTVSVTLGAANEATAITARITNWTSATTSVEGSVINAGGTLNPNPPSQTASWGSANNLFVALVGIRSSSTVTAYPTNYTLYQTIASNTANSNRGETTIAARELANATDDPSTFTFTASDDMVTGTLVIRGA